MWKAKHLWLLLVLTLPGGCEHSQLTSGPQPAPKALSSATRQQLAGTVDLVAMDRLLETLSPEERQQFLSIFADLEAAVTGRAGVETRDVFIPLWFADPERQRLLELMWAPTRAKMPASVRADSLYPLPRPLRLPARPADSLTVRAAGGKP